VLVTIDSILVRQDDLASTDLDGRVVVASVREGSYFDFNQVASDIWQMLSAPCRVRAIFDALSQSHDVDATALSRDVLPFLQNLTDRRLARIVEPDGAS
jgi:hypothetical protein